jgi:hypothetical protein
VSTTSSRAVGAAGSISKTSLSTWLGLGGMAWRGKPSPVARRMQSARRKPGNASWALPPRSAARRSETVATNAARASDSGVAQPHDHTNTTFHFHVRRRVSDTPHAPRTPVRGRASPASAWRWRLHVPTCHPYPQTTSSNPYCAPDGANCQMTRNAFEVRTAPRSEDKCRSHTRLFQG